jgi:type VI protein secretion system component Hcp
VARSFVLLGLVAEDLDSQVLGDRAAEDLATDRDDVAAWAWNRIRARCRERRRRADPASVLARDPGDQAYLAGPLDQRTIRNAKYLKWIQIESFSWGVANPLPENKSDLPAVQQELHLTGRVDRQSPKLFEATATGALFTSAELYVVSDGEQQQVFYKVLAGDVLITSYQVGGTEAAATGLMEQYALWFGGLRNEFIPQRPDGSLDEPIVGTYDFGAPMKR